MISELVKPERTKSSVFSLTSITTAMTAKKKMAKKNTAKNFFNMYQSSFFNAYNLLLICGIIDVFHAL